MNILKNSHSDIWNLGTYCRQKQGEYETSGMPCRRTCVPDSLLLRNDDISECSGAKRMKSSNDSDVYTRNIAFFRAHYTNKNMPKCILHSYAMKNGYDQPVYTTKQADRLFQSIITFQNKKYSSSYWEKNKRFAEQSSALCCILALGLVNEIDLMKNGSLISINK